MLFRRPSRSGIRALLTALLVVMPWPLCAGCNAQTELSVSRTPAQLTAYFVDSYLMEETEISGVCSGLLEENADRYAEFVQANAISDQSGRIGGALRGEISYHLSALIGALGISPAECNGEQLLLSAYQGKFALSAASGAAADFGVVYQARSACKEALEKRFAQFDENEAAPPEASAKNRQSRVFEAFVKSVHLSPADLLDDPMRAARLLDLSPAVMTAMLRFSDAMEGIVDKVASAIPLFGNFARIGLSHLAAELSAWGLEAVLDSLERGHIIHRANVARAACRVLNRSDRHPNVAQKLLKRAVLRFSAHATRVYPPASLCAGMREQGRDLCAEVRSELELDMAQPPPSDQRYTWLVPALPPENPGGAFRNSIELSATLANSTELCAHSACSKEELNRIASVSVFYKREPTPENAGYFRAELAHIDSVMSSLEQRVSEMGSQMQSVGSQVKEMHHALHSDMGGLRTEMLKSREQALQYQTDALKILSRSEGSCACVLKMKRIEAERAKLANTFERCNLGLDSNCLKGVSVDSKSVSNALVAFGFDVMAGSAFDVCGVEPNETDGAVFLEQMKKLINEYKPMHIEVRAHSDQLDPTLKCQSTAGVKDNLELSRKRAEAVRRLLCEDAYFKAMNKPCEELISAEGVGDKIPAITTCPPDRNTGSAAECHAKNRRLGFSFVDSQKLMLTGECAAK